MRRIFLAVLILLTISSQALASKTDNIIGCWSGNNSGTLYLTRDKKFVFNARDASGKLVTSTGKWKYAKSAHALRLKFDDRPNIVLLVKDDGSGGTSAVNSGQKIDLKYIGPGKCE